MSFLLLSVNFLKFTAVDWRTKRIQQFGSGRPVKSAGVLEHGHWLSPYMVNHFIVNYYFSPKSWPAINNILHKWIFFLKVLFISCLLVCIFLFYLQGVQSVHIANHAAQNSQELVLSLMDVWTDSLLLHLLCSNIFTRNIYFCFSLLIAASLPVTHTYVTKMSFSCPLSGTICWQNLIKFTSQISLAICPSI